MTNNVGYTSYYADPALDPDRYGSTILTDEPYADGRLHSCDTCDWLYPYECENYCKNCGAELTAQLYGGDDGLCDRCFEEFHH